MREEAFASLPVRRALPRVDADDGVGRLGEPELGCARRSPPDSDLGLGLDDVTVDVLAHLGRVSSADDFVRGFSMMLSLVVSAGWSEELRREHSLEEVQGLLRWYFGKEVRREGMGFAVVVDRCECACERGLTGGWKGEVVMSILVIFTGE